MILELAGLKKIQERIKELENDGKKKFGIVHPAYALDELKQAKEQFQSDLRAIAKQLETIATHEANSTHRHGLTKLYLENLISAIHSATE